MTLGSHQRTIGASQVHLTRQFGAEHGGALVDAWKLYGAASLFSEAAE
jgi:hypothetical protein